MDFHIIDDITIDEVKKAHIADLAVQDKYNVKYLQFWVNQKAGTVFCLIDGPDKESCEKVHQIAHGGIACQIVEVEGGFYKLFMGDTHKTDHGVVMNDDDSIDKAYRFVLVIDLIGKTAANSSDELSKLILPDKPKRLIKKIIPSYQGRQIVNSDYDAIIAVFSEADEAMACAIEIQSELLKRIASPEEESWNLSFRMGIGGGQPVTINDEFFEKTMKLALRLSLIAGDQQIVASNLVRKLSEIDDKHEPYNTLKAIQFEEETFLENLFNITEKNLSDHAFNVQKLCHDIGISQPQLYRKVTAITGRSPVTFIRDIRLNKALSLIKENRYNLSEIALEIGYNSPSYFSKCFLEKYGVKASKIAV